MGKVAAEEEFKSGNKEGTRSGVTLGKFGQLPGQPSNQQPVTSSNQQPVTSDTSDTSDTLVILTVTSHTSDTQPLVILVILVIHSHSLRLIPQIKRTCTDNFEVNFFMVNHACMTEVRGRSPTITFHTNLQKVI